MPGKPGSFTWQPLIAGEQARRIIDSVCGLAEQLLSSGRVGLSQDSSFGGGLAGLSFLYAELGLITAEARWGQNACSLLDRALEAASASGETSLGLFHGLAGVGWTLHELAAPLGYDLPLDVTAELDEAISTALRRQPWTWEYDLISGLAGMGLYLLDHPNRSFARDETLVLMDRLAELSVAREGGLTWWTAPGLLEGQQRLWYPDGRFDLGVAHGVAGLIGLLARICRSGLGAPQARRLLDSAVQWMLANRRFSDEGSTFSRFAKPVPQLSCRSAWCYGDPGIVAVLIGAAEVQAKPSWKSEAIAIGFKDSIRPVGETEVQDATLCHGTAGLGHIYNCLFQVTGAEVFATTARSWLTATLQDLDGTSNRGAIDLACEEWGLLQGLAGTCLALLAAVGHTQPRWARPMMLDLVVV
ncbi:MAG: lanthionine synthetase C family protein [Acidobacteriota bacterium]|nr:lanthionine synthetase C family protein [Acidobacteriota bacterium]